MNHVAFALAAAGALTAAASADFIGVTFKISSLDINGSGYMQIRFFANFDAPDDTFSFVGGDSGVGVPFHLSTEDPKGFHQAGSSYDPVWGWDIANPYTFIEPEGELDTWIGMGEDIFPLVTSNFLDDLGGHVGALPSATVEDGGVYAIAHNVGVSIVPFANFVVRDGYDIEFGGVIHWDDDDLPNGNITEFYYNNMTPAPSALALLSLAGLASSRRRRA
jgi:MYXO-CTERM domain-containing protein